MPYKSFRDDVEGKIFDAVKRGIDRTLGDAVVDAKANTPVVTGTAQGSIKLEPAKEDDSGNIVGQFGSYDVDYFIWLEIGTRYRPPLNILRNAADKNFSDVISNIKKELRF